MVMSRLTAPWQLIRFAIKAAASDAAARMAETPYARRGDHRARRMLERLVGELRTDLRGWPAAWRSARCSRPSTTACAACAPSSTCRRQHLGARAAGQRAQIADTLRFEIDNRARPRAAHAARAQAADIRPNSMLDPDDVADTEALVKFVGICRQFAGELAINEITQRTVSALADLLQRGTRALVESLRHAGNDDRAFRQSQLDAAVRFCAQVLEPDLAAELRAVADAAGARRRLSRGRHPRRPRCPNARPRGPESRDSLLFGHFGHFRYLILRIAAMIARDVCPHGARLPGPTRSKPGNAIR